jgi:hypothetical protein
MHLERVGAVFLVAGLAVTACSKSGSSVEAAEPMSLDEAAAHVVSTIGDPMVQGADVIADPSDNPGGLPWVRVRIDSNAGDGIKEVWLGRLVEGASGELAHTSDQPTMADVLGGEIVDKGPDGKTVHTPVGMGSGPTGQEFHSPSDQELRDRVDAAAAKFDLGVTSEEVLHPLDSALAVTFTVPAGPVSWNLYQLDQALSGSPADIEGLYVELDSEDGRPLFKSGNTERIKGGGGWFAPGQDERFGFQHG